MLVFSKYPFYRQLQEMDCGPTCLKIVSSYYGKVFALDYLRTLTNVTRIGVNINDIEQAARELGFDTLLVKSNISYLKKERPFPIILHWRQNHFVVLFQITKKNEFIVGDPKIGVLKVSESDFICDWMQAEQKGIALIMEPTENFYNGSVSNDDDESTFNASKQFFRNILETHKKRFYAIIFLVALGTVTAFLVPFTMRKLIDEGIQRKNISVIYAVILFQLAIFIGDMLTECLRSIALVHLSMRISIKIVADFLNKLIRLPIHFFDTKTHADIYQRIEDQNSIQNFLTTKVIQFIFSFILIIALTFQLVFFNWPVFFVFISISILSIGWVFVFYHRRAYINYTKFSLAAANRNHITELIAGMPEVKINNAQHNRVAMWKKVQHQLYQLELRALNLSQYQLLTVKALSQIKGLIITAICAIGVLHGQMTLGAMLSIGYIVGQLRSPLDQLVDFLWTGQDAKIAFDRLNEIQKKEDEDNCEDFHQKKHSSDSLYLTNVYFKYPGNTNQYVLENVTMSIPKAQVTAVVGTSGSGKTTLVKLMLKFYEPNNGNISNGNLNIKQLSAEDWRTRCGVVMQDGYIFSGTIAENIALATEDPDMEKLEHACSIACIDTFIATLPLAYQTKIGRSGLDLSGGQRQRLLIARAVYADPEYLFFDEATSALDSNNEKKIMANLSEFFKGRTVVIIAHRLSTVKNADQIIVLENKRIVEVGNHKQLTEKKGCYYDLVKNQLELGN